MSRITMGLVPDYFGMTLIQQARMYLRVHIVEKTFWPVEGVTQGSHHSSILLRLQFKAFKIVQCAAI